MREQAVAYPHGVSVAASIPIGLCQCGCGQRTAIARWNDTLRGRVKGQPSRFIHGHNGRLLRQTEDTKQRISAGVSPFTSEEKEDAVRLAIKLGSQTAVAERLGVTRETINRWAVNYRRRQAEVNGLSPRQPYDPYTEEFRFIVVQRACELGSKNAAAREFGVATKSIREWFERFAGYCDTGLAAYKEAQEERERCRLEGKRQRALEKQRARAQRDYEVEERRRERSLLWGCVTLDAPLIKTSDRFDDGGSWGDVISDANSDPADVYELELLRERLWALVGDADIARLGDYELERLREKLLDEGLVTRPGIQQKERVRLREPERHSGTNVRRINRFGDPNNQGSTKREKRRNRWDLEMEVV